MHICAYGCVFASLNWCKYFVYQFANDSLNAKMQMLVDLLHGTTFFSCWGFWMFGCLFHARTASKKREKQMRAPFFVQDTRWKRNGKLMPLHNFEQRKFDGFRLSSDRYRHIRHVCRKIRSQNLRTVALLLCCFVFFFCAPKYAVIMYCMHHAWMSVYNVDGFK